MIRVIAVDMDGTFLNDNKHYNVTRFLSQYQRIKHNNMKFVVASGNQYEHLVSFFPTIKDHIGFVAENGAKIYDGDKLIESYPISTTCVSEVLKLIDSNLLFKGYKLVMSGEKNAYIRQDMSQVYQEKAANFYENLTLVDSYSDIQDTIYKFAFNFPRYTIDQCESMLSNYFTHSLKAMTSGHEAVDLVNHQSGKDKGLSILAKKWHIPLDEFAVFGDNLNDLSMFKCVKYSHAVENARPELKLLAHKVIASNNDEGVLDEIDFILGDTL